METASLKEVKIPTYAHKFTSVKKSVYDEL